MPHCIRPCDFCNRLHKYRSLRQNKSPRCQPCQMLLDVHHSVKRAVQLHLFPLLLSQQHRLFRDLAPIPPIVSPLTLIFKSCVMTLALPGYIEIIPPWCHLTDRMFSAKPRLWPQALEKRIWKSLGALLCLFHISPPPWNVETMHSWTGENKCRLVCGCALVFPRLGHRLGMGPLLSVQDQTQNPTVRRFYYLTTIYGLK